MIGAYIMGGIGNQMFQYAVARALSLRLGTDLVLDLSWFNQKVGSHLFYRLSKLHTQSIVPAQIPNFKLIREFGMEEAKEHFQPEIISLPDNSFLLGYWQFEEYFADQAAQIRREFTLKDPISEESRIWARKILEDSMPVSLHIRRGDYLNAININIFQQISHDYYDRCVRILRENFPEMSLYIFSDDLPWCRKTLNFGVPTYFVDANDESRGYEDMFLMSLCRHHIIANSTFSWWGAWLDNRVGSLVFAPKRFFKKSTPYRDSDRIPSRWMVFDI